MRVWQENNGGMRLKLFRNGIEIILLIGLLSIGTGLYFWGNFAKAIEIQNITGRILTERSLAEIAEKDFRLDDLLQPAFYQGANTKNLVQHQAAMAALEKEISELIRALADAEQEAPQTLYRLADEYRKNFVEAVKVYRLRGFKEWGLEGDWRRAMSEVEGSLGGTQNVFAIGELLHLIRHEKDYRSQNEPQYIDAIHADLQQIKSMMLAQKEALSTTIAKALDDYEIAFMNYVLLQQTIGSTAERGLQGEMQRSRQAMESILQGIRQKAFQDGRRAQQTFLTVIGFIWIGGLGLGGAFFHFYAGSITNPIIQMKDAALKIGRGELDTRVAIESNSEVAILARAFNQMATDLSTMHQALRQSEEQSRLIIETANDAFIGMDSHGPITDWNHQAERIFGWSRQEAIGRLLHETVISPQQRQTHLAGMHQFLTTGEGSAFNKRMEMTALHREGHTFPVELTLWPVQMGEVYRFNAFVHDITARKRVEKAVQQSGSGDQGFGYPHRALRTGGYHPLSHRWRPSGSAEPAARHVALPRGAH
jgi:PAS domain S-box-containing protein